MSSGFNLSTRMQTQDIIIRTAFPSEAQIIAEHNVEMAKETEDRPLDFDTTHIGVKAVLNDPGKGFYLVAEASGRIVANLMITFEWSDWRNGNMWWFQSVFVKKEWRKRGIFKLMYDRVMDMAKEKSVKELRLYVDKSNTAAQAVYEQLGMEESHYLMYEVPVD